MKKQAQSGCILLGVSLLVMGCGQRSHQEPPRSPQAEPPDISISTQNVDVQKPARLIVKSETVRATPVSGRPIADAAEKGGGQDGLTVRIELDGTDDNRTINLDEAFRVVLVNDSDRAIRIWNPETENGYYQFSFHFRNLRSGETYLVRKRRIDDREFWESRADTIDSEPATIEIAPKTRRTISVMFSDVDWYDPAWERQPRPNSDDRFAVIAQFESTTQEGASSPRVLNGKTQSVPISARLICPRLKTPYDYLQDGFASAALEMKTDDLKWVSARDSDSCTPLHHAAQFGQVHAVKWLLDHGADVNAIAYNGFTPLHLTNDERVIELILHTHPDLNIRCRAQGQTPLQLAAANLVNPIRWDEREKWRRIVKMYRDSGAEYDILTAIHLEDLEQVKEVVKKSPAYAHEFQDRTPLRTAAALGRLKICRYLIEEHHVDLDDFKRGGGYPIIKGALAHPRVVELLIKSGADLKTRITLRGLRTGTIIGDDATALHYAAANGVPESIKLLIDSGIDIFATAHDMIDKIRLQTALEVAAIYRKADNANVIVSHPKFSRADRQLKQRLLDKCLFIGAFPSDLARDAQRPKLIELLLNGGANPNSTDNGVTAMQTAARRIIPSAKRRNLEIKQIIALLRTHGATVDLFSAVAIGDEEEVRRLLEKDPTLANSRAADGYPALPFAVGMNYKNIVPMLLKAGGEVDIRNKSKHIAHPGETALHCAAFWGRYEIAALLIDAGADVNALTERKSTPLHDAARLTNAKVARLLLEKGAKPDARDKDNETPLDSYRASKTKN
jgi:ankyrin repeat protein